MVRSGDVHQELVTVSDMAGVVPRSREDFAFGFGVQLFIELDGVKSELGGGVRKQRDEQRRFHDRLLKSIACLEMWSTGDKPLVVPDIEWVLPTDTRTGLLPFRRGGNSNRRLVATRMGSIPRFGDQTWIAIKLPPRRRTLLWRSRRLRGRRATGSERVPHGLSPPPSKK